MRKITIIVIIVIALAVLCIASDSVAQTGESPGKFYVGFSAGLSGGSTTVGGKNNSTNGLLFTGIAGFGKDGCQNNGVYYNLSIDNFVFIYSHFLCRVHEINSVSEYSVSSAGKSKLPRNPAE